MAKFTATALKVMHTNQLGFDIFIAPSNGALGADGIEITDKIEEATIWDERDSDIKLDYYRWATGYDQLQWKSI
jgi:hypothetical protein